MPDGHGNAERGAPIACAACSSFSFASDKDRNGLTRLVRDQLVHGSTISS